MQVIKRARFRLYPLNRVGVTIEKYGEWNVGILDSNSLRDISSYEELQRAQHY